MTHTDRRQVGLGVHLHAGDTQRPSGPGAVILGFLRGPALPARRGQGASSWWWSWACRSRSTNTGIIKTNKILDIAPWGVDGKLTKTDTPPDHNTQGDSQLPTTGWALRTTAIRPLIYKLDIQTSPCGRKLAEFSTRY